MPAAPHFPVCCSRSCAHPLSETRCSRANACSIGCGRPRAYESLWWLPSPLRQDHTPGDRTETESERVISPATGVATMTIIDLSRPSAQSLIVRFNPAVRGALREV